MAQICGKITLPNESIKTQKLPKGKNLITKSEAPAPEIVVVNKF